ncbi:MAG: hypothetical protein M1274_15300 [Actinobacteria bacterium]|nr:hypothetical protein [Actinomycetota bacterium]
MARITSAAGEMDVQFASVSAQDGGLLLAGKFDDRWNWQIVLGPADVRPLFWLVVRPHAFLPLVRATWSGLLRHQAS